MFRQLIDRTRGVWRSEDQAPDDPAEERDGSSRRTDASMSRRASDDSTRVSASRKIAAAKAAPTKYPLSWPARDLARTRRLQSPSQDGSGHGQGPGPADEPDLDPTTVWRPGDGADDDGR